MAPLARTGTAPWGWLPAGDRWAAGSQPGPPGTPQQRHPGNSLAGLPEAGAVTQPRRHRSRLRHEISLGPESAESHTCDKCARSQHSHTDSAERGGGAPGRLRREQREVLPSLQLLLAPTPSAAQMGMSWEGRKFQGQRVEGGPRSWGGSAHGCSGIPKAVTDPGSRQWRGGRAQGWVSPSAILGLEHS